MSKDTITKTTWTLTVIRDYESGMNDEIEEAKFAFGRTSNEMSNESKIKTIFLVKLKAIIERKLLKC